MKRAYVLAPLALTMALAACSGGGGGADMRAGQWEIVTQMTEIDAPGLPDAVKQQMRTQMTNQRQTQSQCITAEQARNPSRNMMGAQNPAGCQFSDTTWAGGTIRIRANCRPPGSPAVEMTIDGTYGADTLNGRIGINTQMPSMTGSGTQAVRVQGTLTGRRTGDCPG